MYDNQVPATLMLPFVTATKQFNAASFGADVARSG
jgi:hypothetical protein